MKNLKEIIKEIKEDILGEEMWFYQLDNYMMSEGFCSVMEEGAMEDIEWAKNAIFVIDWENDEGVQVFFVITENEGENGEGFKIKVTGIEKF